MTKNTKPTGKTPAPKRNKTATLHCRLLPETFELLEQLARADDRTNTAMIERMIHAEARKRKLLF